MREIIKEKIEKLRELVCLEDNELLKEVDKKLFDKHLIEICKVCPWNKESHHPELLCEGYCCDEALDIWKDDQWIKFGLDYDKTEGDK